MARRQYVNKCIKYIRENENVLAHVVAGGKLTVKGKQPEDSDITDEDAKKMLEIATRHVYETERDKKYLIVVKAPKACTNAELDQFAAKVADGGEVAGGIRQRTTRAFRLGMIVYEDAVVGTAALKKPAASYRTKVFKQAGSQLDPAAYPYELGWIFLDIPHRRKGQMTRLINDLLSAAKGSALFATTRTSNDIMQEMLAQIKFSENGTEYQSEQNPAEAVKLFLRTAPQIETIE